MKKIIIGVMGPGERATEKDIKNARRLGKLIAQEGWVLLTGGRNQGVMDAASRGAKEGNGLTVGILPTSDPHAVSEAVDIPIFTDMSSARNNINVLSSHVVVACGIGAGTASEIALALKANRQVILLGQDELSQIFFRKIGKDNIVVAKTPQEVIGIIKKKMRLN